MKKQTKFALVSVLLGAMAWTVGFFDGDPSDEEQVRAAIKEVASGIEAADIAQAMGPVSETYIDAEGMNRKGLYGLLWSQFRKRGPIGVWMSAIDVGVEGDGALASFDAAVFEKEKGATIALPVSADLLTFEVELQREDDEWRVVAHTRTPALQLNAPPP